MTAQVIRRNFARALPYVALAVAGSREHTNDVATVVQQQLTSSPDENLASICATENRCLVTLDKDFSDPLRYPPRNYAGIVVVRLPGKFQLSLLEQALGLLGEASRERDVRGRLWIAEIDRVREYQERTE